MAGIKRKLSSCAGSPPHKVARNESILHIIPSQTQKLALSNPTVASDEPEDFQLKYESTNKSLSELGENEKSHWRQYSDPRSFFEFTGWDPIVQEEFEAPFFIGRAKNTPFQVQLEKTARAEVSGVHSRFISNERINWTRLLPLWTIPRSDAAVDDMIFTWIELKRINYDMLVDGSQDQALINHLATRLPIVKRKEEKCKEAELAFHTRERHYSDGTKASDSLYEKLVECYNKYNPMEHLAPYTSIVGPSGIGKSFMVQQLSVSHGIYVVYVSFARGSIYPCRSAVADKILQFFPRRPLEEFWRMFITTSLAEVEACKAVGITPAGFYNLQTKYRYRSYQENFADRVDHLSKRYLKQKERNCYNNILSDIITYISSPEKFNQMSIWRADLDRNGDNGGAVMKQKRVGRNWIPETFLCFDEARELIDSRESLLFRSLRTALRNCFEMKSGPKNTWGDFFGVLLDTTSKVANSPPSILDSEGYGRRLFPPIYQIKTMDVLIDNSYSAEEEVGSPEAAIKLFRYGRPLWGSRYCADKIPRDVVHEVIGLAIQKTDGDSPTKALALMSYRLEFDLTDIHLAEQMVSNCLRLVAFMNTERGLMRTIQPTEPILAYTAALRMINSQTRCNVLREFVSSCFEEKLKSTRDVGEMVAAMILMFAYDEKQFNYPRALPTPILVKDFMQALFGSGRCDDMAQRMNTDKDMKKLWHEGLVYFNHVVNLQQAPSHETLANAFNRAAAFFLPPGFPGADIIIPIKTPGVQTMTFCAVQVKNHKYDTFTSKVQNDAMADLKAATDALEWPQNHIAIMMCLRYKQYHTQKKFDILLPKPLSNQTTRHTSKIHKAQRADGDGVEGDADMTYYNWPRDSKRLVVMAVGMEESVNESINLCRGEQTTASSEIPTLLKKLLDCIPGSSFPDEADMDHVDRLFPLG